MREPVRAFWCALLALAALLVGGVARAHEVGLSRGEYQLEGSTAVVQIVFARREVATLVPAMDVDRDEHVTEAEVRAARAAIEERVVGGVLVQADGAPCRGQLREAQLVEEDGLRVALGYQCPAEPRKLGVELGLLDQLATGHRHIASARVDGKPVDHVLSRKSRAFELTFAGPAPPPPSAASAFGEMVVLGIEHIVFGYDHLIFLLGLVLVGGSWRSLLMVITAFTVGHSITLALAVLGVFVPSPRIIEPAIALSIAYVGIENYFVPDAEKRWRITLPFGLIHGFGFAGALSEVAVPDASVPLKLVAFNLGVEAGQLAIMAAVLPLVLFARKQDWFKNLGVKAISAAITVAGVFWFVTRVADV
jgi:hypothetical protein